MEQVLPGSEEALKAKARMEEEARQIHLKKKQNEELGELCKLFSNMDPGVIEAVYETCEHSRTAALASLLDMVGSEGGGLDQSLRGEVERLAEQIHYKRAIVTNHIRCPITGEVMEDPVFASDGYSYERKSIQKWMNEHSTSPSTGEALPSKDLIANHQLRSQIQSWLEQEEDAKDGEGVLPAVAFTPTAAAGNANGAVVLEALEYGGTGNGKVGVFQNEDDNEAGAGPGDNSGGFVAKMVQALGESFTASPTNGAATNGAMNGAKTSK
eukprot:CAMPEP_0184328596 /NCGR_PEP_ID=MMETSP1049-20130417/143705_1 /TAXON_ID=77928 /ORGANISM="Proteomonas sulcata, Strain CCMP704" /LENGTH=268 /DNA_ID=CAMNT_0026650915 /DNA_START=983 /DNA_END=1789 /DNA_ORIENTATION=+